MQLPQSITMKPIGFIVSPYKKDAPYQPVAHESGFSLVIDPRYAEALYRLDGFSYIYLLYYLDQAPEPKLTVTPPWTGDLKAGLFATRTPARPNPIGLSVVRVLGIAHNIITISGLDALDGTPILDIKPYIAELDVKNDANYGWLDEVPDREHFKLHLRGIPHDY